MSSKIESVNIYKAIYVFYLGQSIQEWTAK